VTAKPTPDHGRAGLPVLRRRTVLYYPGGQEIEVKHGKAVIPSHGAHTLQCGKCASFNFVTHVTPGLNGAVRVKAIVCGGCGKVFNLNERSEIGGTATTIEALDHAQREKLNARPEDS